MDTLVLILKILAVIATIGTGLLALILPKSIFGFTGLQAEGGRGITEIRAIFGAAFIAVGAVALYYRIPETYLMLGVGYLFVALVRLVSMFVDNSFVRSNSISLVVEIIFGIILVIPG